MESKTKYDKQLFEWLPTCSTINAFSLDKVFKQGTKIVFNLKNTYIRIMKKNSNSDAIGMFYFHGNIVPKTQL